MCFNHNNRMIFLGSVERFSQVQTKLYESLVPTIYALECNGYLVTLMDKLHIGGVESSQGIFTISSHPSENIVFCTFNTHVVIASFSGKKFLKCKTIEKFSDSIIYQSGLADRRFFGYCPRNESINLLVFEEKKPAKIGWLDQSDALTSDYPLQTHFFTIKEFKNDIRFILVDEKVNLLFAFRSHIHKCSITRNSLTLDQKSVHLGILL